MPMRICARRYSEGLCFSSFRDNRTDRGTKSLRWKEQYGGCHKGAEAQTEAFSKSKDWFSRQFSRSQKEGSAEEEMPCLERPRFMREDAPNEIPDGQGRQHHSQQGRPDKNPCPEKSARILAPTSSTSRTHAPAIKTDR